MLYESIRDLHCCSLSYSSQKDALFYNFKVSARGSIRRPPNLVDWVQALQQLALRAGERDTGGIVKRWNAQCSKQMQIVGRKAMALKCLLEQMPQEGLDVVTQVVSASWWEESPWTEEVLACKRIYPGAVFRVDGSKQWTSRQTVVRESCVLMLKRVEGDFNRKQLKGKLTERHIADRAQMAAVVISVSKELGKLAPIPESEVEAWIKMWQEGEPGLEMELKSVVMSHEDKFSLRELTTLAEILDKHSGRVVGSNRIHACTEKVRIQASELEESTWQLFLKQINYEAMWSGPAITRRWSGSCSATA